MSDSVESNKSDKILIAAMFIGILFIFIYLPGTLTYNDYKLHEQIKETLNVDDFISMPPQLNYNGVFEFYTINGEYLGKYMIVTDTTLIIGKQKSIIKEVGD